MARTKAVMKARRAAWSRANTVTAAKRRRARTRGRIVSLNPIGRTLGFPKKLLFKHKYSATHLITSTTGVAQQQSYAANGMGDPDITGSGHQPMYYDQMNALYNHYCVVGSMIRYRIMPATASAQVPMRVIAWINDANSTIPTTVDAVQESKYAQTRLIGGINTPHITNLTNRWSAKKFFGGSPLSNDELSAAGGSNNPAEVSYFFLTVQAMDATSTVSIQVIVDIIYIAVWTELKEIDSS